MHETETLPAPELNLSTGLHTKWEREHAAFLAMRAELLAQYRDQHVAIHEGKVVASGTNKISVALEAYRRYGHVPIHVGLVSEEPPPAARLPSPRYLRSR